MNTAAVQKNMVDAIALKKTEFDTNEAVEAALWVSIESAQQSHGRPAVRGSNCQVACLAVGREHLLAPLLSGRACMCALLFVAPAAVNFDVQDLRDCAFLLEAPHQANSKLYRGQQAREEGMPKAADAAVASLPPHPTPSQQPHAPPDVRGSNCQVAYLAVGGRGAIPMGPMSHCALFV
jgi:hypothetical protein